jgi:hypothetical protein
VSAPIHKLAKTAGESLKVLLFIIILELVLVACFPSRPLAFELTGYVKAEGKLFFNEALFSRQQRSSISVAAQPELYHEW